MNKYILIVLMFASSLVLAEERMVFLEGGFSSSLQSCSLRESGKALKDNYFEFKGITDERITYCDVSIKKTDFYKRFKFCAIGSVNTKDSNQGYCCFKYSERSGSYHFLSMLGRVSTSGDKNGIGSVECSFVCLAKSDGDHKNP